MKITSTNFEGLFVIEPHIIEDHRGFFMESYNKQKLKELGLDFDFVQDNHSRSSYGVIRGLHFQNPPYAQTKLIRVVQGEILDVVVDIRKSSATFGQHYAIRLSAENKKQLLVPKGFAHGFSTLTNSAEILYKCDNYYNKDSEGGLLYNDQSISTDWLIPSDKIIVSEKDKTQPILSKLSSQF